MPLIDTIRQRVEADYEHIFNLFCHYNQNPEIGMDTFNTSQRQAEELRAAGGSIRAVVSDLRMPRMGGHELYEEIRKTYPALPFVLCTGFGDSSDLSMLVLDPRASLVDKPFRIEDLVRTIERIASIH